MTTNDGAHDGRLAFTRKGSGPPVVFLHGLGASQAQSQATLADVPGIELITIDAPAHGGSASSTVPLDFGSFASAIAGLLDELDVGPAIIGGISMGSGIALRIAVDFPDQVTGLVLVRPAWTDKPGRPHLNIVADVGAWISADGIEATRARLEADDRYQQMMATSPLLAGSVAAAIDARAVAGHPEVLMAMVDSHPVDALSDLAAVAQRALLISNESDPLHPTEVADEIATALPNAELKVAPPRYLEAEAHQDFLTTTINTFIADDLG